MKFKKIIKILCIIFLCIIVINIKSIFKSFYPIKYEEHIVTYSQRYNVDPCLVAAVIKAESDFNGKAMSNRGAYGLMQIMPDTGLWIAQNMQLKDYKVEKLYDNEINIAMGCWYINNLNTEFNGDIDLVLAAYNGGRGNVQKWLKNKEYSQDGKKINNIPFGETDKYVKKVKTNYKIYFKLYGDKFKVS
ncbi:lytic transglycosylase domain-containing protein [Clostridium tagluense]|uniref:Transglycosylase SLT domain protein n=1 Tax=Clostridium tagluense TaxID=360422 RepID=A0A401UHX8_9CLOT|nr:MULTISPECIES: lytic transglycosylase domain-containing protein [Clostridium]MBU3128385.1 lytic transglycosylase domain-containing protein [Clostridium tagluense]MBZ9624721.1 lytic transglycosylase domain-containing protein [Clostridium sp. FP2]MCB2297345.1 lytic transglycosylase domain-containing protein [Clostridium tagluense]MCB2313159.1 lytic transglycosylase domain-containing protein [Clostridium tagluense]MCB2317925.1 lytic transglycosylase domain-containing protein [Clostridium taglue